MRYVQGNNSRIQVGQLICWIFLDIPVDYLVCTTSLSISSLSLLLPVPLMHPGDTGESCWGVCPVLQQCRKLPQQLLVLLSNGDLTVHFSLCRGAGAPNIPKKMHLSHCKDGRLLQEGAESGTGACFSNTFDKYSIAWESNVISLSTLWFLKWGVNISSKH